MSGRELRFRVWDRKAAHYSLPMGPVYVCGESGYPAVRQECRNEGNYFSLGEDQRNWVIEQWTGLADRNGRDIYEGDLLTDWDDNDPPLVVAWAKAYSGPQWCLLDRRGEVSDFYGGLQSDSRAVVGNRHEHPHLLSAGQMTAINPSLPST